VDYTPGATNTFESGFGGDTSSVRTKLPTETVKGSINVTINCTAFYLDDVMFAIKQFVRNPTTAGDYTFTTDDGKKATVTITVPSGRGIVVSPGKKWYVDTTGNHVADDVFMYGMAEATPLVGDFGSEDTAVVIPGGRWYVDTTHNHAADQIFAYGMAGSTPLVGDIDGDGIDDIAVVTAGCRWYVNTSGNRVAPAADLIFSYGMAGATPLVGDFDGNGIDDIAVVTPGSRWYVNTDGNRVAPAADLIYMYGMGGSTPLVGDLG